MNKRKRILYSLVVLVLLVFWASYLFVVTMSIDNSSRHNLTSVTGYVSAQMDKNLRLNALSMLRQVESFNLGPYRTVDDCMRLLHRIQVSGAGFDYLLVSRDGFAQDVAGKKSGLIIQEDILDSARQRGYEYVDLDSSKEKSDRIALLLPYPGNQEYFLARIGTMEDYKRVLFTDIDIPAKYIAIFNRWGGSINTIEDATGYQKEDVAAEVQHGAVDFATRPESGNVLRQSMSFKYDIYIPISQPANWFLGARVHAADLSIIHNGMGLSVAFALLSCVLFVAALSAFELLNKRDRRQDLVHASGTDPLTGLNNTIGMDRCLNLFSQSHTMTDYNMIALDIVAFHRFNTVFGHLMGDALLQVIGEILMDNCNCAARTGGDVFTFLAPKTTDPIHNILPRIEAAVSQKLGNQFLQAITLKFGVYPILDGHHSLRETQDGVMLALKTAKRSPDKAVVIYDRGLQAQADFERDVESSMFAALAKGEFEIFVQPKFDTKNERCCGGEALVRWSSNQLGFLSPTSFISIFEQNGFILEVDFFVLEEVLLTLQDHYNRGLPLYPISVNQSRITITLPNYLDRLSALVKDLTFPLRYVELEITESIMETGEMRIIPLLTGIRQIGFSIAMDDFGSGFSSLSTLMEYPVNVLKIDKNFLRASSNSKSRKIIRSIINMAWELDMDVVCEGVETESQLSFLRDSGCPVAQGFYFSKPIRIGSYVSKYIADEITPAIPLYESM